MCTGDFEEYIDSAVLEAKSTEIGARLLCTGVSLERQLLDED